MKCDGCTLCCRLLPVPELDKLAGDMCVNCKEGEGCTIHDERPSVCRGFFCAYAQVEKANILVRPDNCGVVFEKVDDTIMFGTVDPTRSEYPHLMGQVRAFNKQGLNVVLGRDGISSYYLIEGVSVDSVIEIIMEKANGSRIL